MIEDVVNYIDSLIKTIKKLEIKQKYEHVSFLITYWSTV